MPSSDLFRGWALAAAFTLAAAAHAAPTRYAFELLTPRPALDAFPNLIVPALNARGEAAFGATVKGHQEGLFRSSGGVPAVMARDRRFFRFGDVSINAAGDVAFEGSPRSGLGEGIFRSNGMKIVQIAGTRDAGDFDFVNAGPSMNRQGRVAFIGERIVGGDFIDGVYAGSGAGVQAVYDETGAFDDFNGNPAINDRNDVAFLATLDNGTSGLFVGRGGTSFTTVADDTGPLTGSLAWSDPSLNDHGDVAFSAGTNPDFGDNGSSTSSGIFLWQGGVLTTVVEGGFDQFFSLGDPSLNNLGQVAFVAEPTFGQQILVTGPDFVENRVLASGDTLYGRTVQNIAFSREGLNDAGQLAFIAYFTDGSSGVFIATPAAAH
jgi:hypothetical protein